MVSQQNPGGVPQQPADAPTPVNSPPPIYQANDTIQPIPLQLQPQPQQHVYPPQQQHPQQGVMYAAPQQPHPVDEKAQFQPQPQVLPMQHHMIPMQPQAVATPVQVQMMPPAGGQPMYVMTPQGPMLVQGGAVMVGPDGKTTVAATSTMVAAMPQQVQVQAQPAITNTTTVVHTQGGSSAAAGAAGGAAGGFCGGCCGALAACCCCCTVM